MSQQDIEVSPTRDITIALTATTTDPQKYCTQHQYSKFKKTQLAENQILNFANPTIEYKRRKHMRVNEIDAYIPKE